MLPPQSMLPPEPDPESWVDLTFASDALAEVLKFALSCGYSYSIVDSVLVVLRGEIRISLSLTGMTDNPLQVARSLWELIKVSF